MEEELREARRESCTPRRRACCSTDYQCSTCGFSVTGTQAVFQTLTGQQKLPQLVVVASSLLIAALFTPLRRRIQSFIDRRFYRRKYDPAKTLETFSAKLRNETVLDALSDDLVGVVGETMQPKHISLWLHPDPAFNKDKKKRAAIRESGRDKE